jgi:curved DNA-binding protein CbpA
MSQEPAAPGVVERSLGEHIREQSNGILAIGDGKVRRLFCLQRGRLVHAASNLIEEQLGEFLVHESYLAAADRDRSVREGALEGVEDLQWLQDEGLIETSELDKATGLHATGLLLSALGSQNSDASFQEGTPNLKGKPVTDLATADILFEFLKEHPKSSQETRARVGSVAMHPVRVVKKESEIKTLAKSHPILDEIWKLCDGDLTVLQLAGAISAGLDPALRALYGMMLLGTVETISRKARSERRVEDVPVTRNELMMRLQKAIEANHYGVLELNAQTDEDTILSSYYLLARRYHPDRFRAGELVDLLPRIEAFFSQVTEAYNTLADPELRKDYDAALMSEDQRTQEEPEHDTSHLARQNYLAAKSLIKRKQFRQAIKFLENAIELEENIPEYHVEFGSLIARNPVRREEAEEHLRLGLELDPTVLDGHTALADLLVKRDKPTNAIQVLTEALKWFPDHPDLKSRLKELGVGESRGLFGR